MSFDPGTVNLGYSFGTLAEGWTAPTPLYCNTISVVPKSTRLNKVDLSVRAAKLIDDILSTHTKEKDPSRIVVFIEDQMGRNTTSNVIVGVIASLCYSKYRIERVVSVSPKLKNDVILLPFEEQKNGGSVAGNNKKKAALKIAKEMFDMISTDHEADSLLQVIAYCRRHASHNGAQCI